MELFLLYGGDIRRCSKAAQTDNGLFLLQQLRSPVYATRGLLVIVNE